MRALHKPLALRGVGMNRLGDVFEPRAHFEGQAKRRRQLRNSSANPLNAKQEVIAGPCDHADEAGLVLKRHGPAVGPEREDCGLDRGSGSLGLGGSVLKNADGKITGSAGISGLTSAEDQEVADFLANMAAQPVV